MAEPRAEDNRTPIEALIAQLGVDRVYGEARREGEVTIIPVAEVTVGLGYGSGHGPAGTGRRQAADAAAEDAEGPSEPAPAAMSGGEGGGAGGRITPRGYIRITGEGVSYHPIVDAQRLALAGMLLSGWIVFWVARTVRAFARR